MVSVELVVRFGGSLNEWLAHGVH